VARLCCLSNRQSCRAAVVQTRDAEKPRKGLTKKAFAASGPAVGDFHKSLIITNSFCPAYTNAKAFRLITAVMCW
jgi:hypothetical protein